MRYFYSNKKRGLDVIFIHDICVSMTIHMMLFPIKRKWNVISRYKIFCSQGNSQNDCSKQGDFQPSISRQLGLSNYNNFEPNNDCPKWQIPTPIVTMPWCYLRLSIGKYVCNFGNGWIIWRKVTRIRIRKNSKEQRVWLR